MGGAAEEVDGGVEDNVGGVNVGGRGVRRGLLGFVRCKAFEEKKSRVS